MMNNQIILATNNAHKLTEVKAILEPLGFAVLSQSEAGVNIDVAETGTTFEENAYIKAKAVYDIAKTPVISDDSGLAVDFLNGEPGVYSARYADDNKHCEKLLNELNGVPDDKRTARFVCVICYINGQGEVKYAKGTVEGKIGFEQLGEGGFGYDPVFMYGGQSFAQISADEKNAVSHRAAALKKLTEML